MTSASRPKVMPSRASASCTSSRALKIRHFTVASVVSSASAISLYDSPTTSRSKSAIFKSVLRPSTADHSADHLERRRIIDRDERSRPAFARTKLVENAVLRHLEEPRRELRPQREPRKALEDAD